MDRLPDRCRATARAVRRFLRRRERGGRLSATIAASVQQLLAEILPRTLTTLEGCALQFGCAGSIGSAHSFPAALAASGEHHDCTARSQGARPREGQRAADAYRDADGPRPFRVPHLLLVHEVLYQCLKQHRARHR